MQYLPSLSLLAFPPLLLALILRLSPGRRPRRDWRPWAGCALLLALFFRLVDPLGALLLLLPPALLWIRERCESVVLRAGFEGLIVLWCLALALHRLPGIHNPLLCWGALSPHAADYHLYGNLDKAYAGLYLFGLVVQREPPAREGRYLAPIIPLLLLAMAVAWVGGLTQLEPRWSKAFLLWAPANLLLTVLPEEVLFRMLLQDRLEACLRGGPWGGVAALALAAALFGLAHLQGGWVYGVSATLAGLGYGCAYRYRRNPWHPVMAHFGLNALHFLAFVYPWIHQ